MPKAIDSLIKGYQEFRKNYFGGTNYLFESLVKGGQTPKVLVIACSDSRVDPAILTNCQPGDLFVVRNVANLVPTYENDMTTHHGISAALEFAIFVLEVQEIIVLGHTSCGGINALVTGTGENIRPNSFISRWMDLAQPARERVLQEHSQAPLDQKLEICEQYAIVNSLKNLCTFPWVKDRVKSGNLFLHGWHFNLLSGTLQAFNQRTNSFEELKASAPSYEVSE